LPKQEKSAPKNVPASYVLPEDVVEVHQDAESKQQVTQYLDQSKNVILQVPSNEELSVERGIAQELQQAAKLRANADAAPASEQGKKYGD
jgi:cAMP phosphodiesterase